MVCGLSLALIAGCGTGDDGGSSRSTLVVGTDATYPPFESVNTATGLPEGFDIDLISRVAEISGWQTEFIVTPFDGIIPGLLNKKYDCIISALTITPQRAAVVAFSDPYYLAGQVVAVPLDDSVIRGIGDLDGKRIGVQLGTTGEMMARKIAEAQLFSFDNIGAAFLDMANGKLDAVLNDLPTTEAYIRAHGDARIVGPVLSEEHYGVAVRPEDTLLLRQINAALATMRRDTSYVRLHRKWFGTEGAESHVR